MTARTPPMLPDEVRDGLDAVERSLCANYLPSAPVLAQWQALRARLLAREAEVERLQNIADGNAELYQHELLRTERAEALLREVADCAQSAIKAGDWKVDGACDPGSAFNRITAHLSENSRG